MQHTTVHTMTYPNDFDNTKLLTTLTNWLTSHFRGKHEDEDEFYVREGDQSLTINSMVYPNDFDNIELVTILTDWFMTHFLDKYGDALYVREGDQNWSINSIIIGDEVVDGITNIINSDNFVTPRNESYRYVNCAFRKCWIADICSAREVEL